MAFQNIMFRGKRRGYFTKPNVIYLPHTHVPPATSTRSTYIHTQTRVGWGCGACWGGKLVVLGGTICGVGKDPFWFFAIQLSKGLGWGTCPRANIDPFYDTFFSAFLFLLFNSFVCNIWINCAMYVCVSVGGIPVAKYWPRKCHLLRNPLYTSDQI